MSANQEEPNKELIQEWKDEFEKNYEYKPSPALLESQTYEISRLEQLPEEHELTRVQKWFEYEKIQEKWIEIYDDDKSKEKARKLTEWLEIKTNEYRAKKMEIEDLGQFRTPIKMADVPPDAGLGSVKISSPPEYRTVVVYCMLKCRWCEIPPSITDRDRFSGYRGHLKKQHPDKLVYGPVTTMLLMNLFGTKIGDATEEWYQERMRQA